MTRLQEILERKHQIKTELQNESITTEQLDAFDEELRALNEEEGKIEERNQHVKDISNKIGDLKVVEKRGKDVELDKLEIFNTKEYRKAFMDYVVRGKELPVEFRANTLTSDVGAVVPPETLNRIIEKVQAHGMILPLVTKTNYKAGVSIPTSTVKPVATWVSEGAGSEKQKKTVTNIVFTHFKLRCAVSVSLETEYMSLSAFEATLEANIAEAMAVALESAIINGNGSSMPKGVLKETGVSVAGAINYKTLVKAEGELPIEYEQNAVWVMSKSTFMNEFIGMVDTAGQPIARIDYGISGKAERTLLGRPVVLTNYLPTEEDSPVAFLFDFSDYILNTNFSIALKVYEDNETDDIIRKSILVADGKVIDAGSLVTLTGK